MGRKEFKESEREVITNYMQKQTASSTRTTKVDKDFVELVEKNIREDVKSPRKTLKSLISRLSLTLRGQWSPNADPFRSLGDVLLRMKSLCENYLKENTLADRPI